MEYILIYEVFTFRDSRLSRPKAQSTWNVTHLVYRFYLNLVSVARRLNLHGM